MADILIIEDDSTFGELLVMHLEDRDHTPHLARTAVEAEEQLARSIPDAVLLDHQLPDGYGLDLLEAIARQAPATPVIMITGVTDNALAIEAMRQGAYDFIRKPMDELELDTTLNNALRNHRLSRQVSAITDSDEFRVDVSQIVGTSPAILEICKTVGAVAAHDAPILVTGESGTGKEVVARAIHHHSGRTGLFLAVNCSALAEGLLESELFGHERGSFTGAVGRKEGRFEFAAGGTLFLDEVGDMPAPLQAKLLRVLQEGSFERVGGNQTRHSDARIIAATNRDIVAMTHDGRFREDLYYRLNVVHIDVPPLRARMEDLPSLSEHLLKKINTRQHTAIENIAENAWRRLKQYDWPGNIRELENILTRATILSRGTTITIESLDMPDETVTGSADDEEATPSLRLVSLEVVEQEHVAAVLRHVRWHKGKACEILGISRPALERKIEKYHIE